MLIFLAAIREEPDLFANVSIQTTEGSVCNTNEYEWKLGAENRDHNHYMAKRKKANVNSTALMSKKMKLTILIHYFLLKRPQYQKMTERAPESDDWHAIVAARCR